MKKSVPFIVFKLAVAVFVFSLIGSGMALAQLNGGECWVNVG